MYDDVTKWSEREVNCLPLYTSTPRKYDVQHYNWHLQARGRHHSTSFFETTLFNTTFVIYRTWAKHVRHNAIPSKHRRPCNTFISCFLSYELLDLRRKLLPREQENGGEMMSNSLTRSSMWKINLPKPARLFCGASVTHKTEAYLNLRACNMRLYTFSQQPMAASPTLWTNRGAAISGHVKCVRLLLEHGQELKLSNHVLRSPPIRCQSE